MFIVDTAVDDGAEASWIDRKKNALISKVFHDIP